MENTKLEKLKEIKADNLVSTEDLKEIVGGTDYRDGYSGWANDSRFLNVLLGGDVCDRYGDYKASNHIDEITNAWGKVGVEVKVIRSEMKLGDIVPEKTYGFFINGTRCKHKRDAYEHAMKVVGKHLEPKDWCW